MQGRGHDLASTSRASRAGTTYSGSVENSSSSHLFDDIYTAAAAGNEERLTAIYATYACLQVRRGIYTPLNLLAEKGDHKAVALLINQFGASLIEATIGYARGGYVDPVKELLAEGVSVAYAIEGFATRNRTELANAFMAPYAERPKELQLLQRAAYAGGLLGGRKGKDILASAEIPLEQIERDIFQLAIAGRFKLIKKILDRQYAQISQVETLDHYLQCTVIEGAVTGGDFGKVNHYLCEHPDDWQTIKRILLATVIGGHFAQFNQYTPLIHDWDKVEILRAHAQQGNFAKVEEILTTVSISKKTKNKMLEETADAFKYGDYFITDALARRSLAFIQNTDLRNHFAKLLKLPAKITSEATKVNAMMRKYNLDYKLAFVWLNFSEQLRKLFLAAPVVMTTISIKLPRLPPELIMMIASHLVPSITPEEIIELYNKTTFYLYKNLLVNALKSYSGGCINLEKYKHEAKEFTKSCMQAPSMSELAHLLMTEINTVFNTRKKDKYITLLMTHYNRLQKTFYAGDRRGRKEQELFNTIYSLADNGNETSLANLVASGVSVSAHRRTDTPIMLLAQQSKRRAVMLLLRFGGSINEAVCGAAMSGNIPLVEEFLKLGASIDYVVEGLARVNHPALKDYLIAGNSSYYAVRGAARGGHDELVIKLINAVILPLEHDAKIATARTYAIRITGIKLKMLTTFHAYAAEGYALSGNVEKVQTHVRQPTNSQHHIALLSLKNLAIGGDVEQIKRHPSFAELFSMQEMWNGVGEGLAMGGNLETLSQLISSVHQQAREQSDIDHFIQSVIKSCIIGGYNDYAKKLIYRYAAQSSVDFTLSATCTHIEMGNFDLAMKYIQLSCLKTSIPHAIVKYAQQDYFADDKSPLRFLTLLALIEDANLRERFAKAAEQLQDPASKLLKKNKKLNISTAFQELQITKSFLQKAAKLNELKNKYALNIKQLFAFILLKKDVRTWLLEFAATSGIPAEVLSDINFSLFKDYLPDIIFFTSQTLTRAEIDNLCDKMMMCNAKVDEIKSFHLYQKFLLGDLHKYSSCGFFNTKPHLKRTAALKSLVSSETICANSDIAKILNTELAELKRDGTNEEGDKYRHIITRHCERLEPFMR